MKKHVKTLALILVLACALGATACSCTGGVNLSFSPYWTYNRAYTNQYKEELTYNVSTKKEFVYSSYDFSRDKNKGVDTDVTGTYKVVTEAISVTALPQFLAPCVTSSEFLKNTTQFYKQTTTLNLIAEYKYSDTEIYYNNDVTESIAYFADCAHSLAPIYSQKSFDNTYLDASGFIHRNVYSTSIIYNNKNATLTVLDGSTTVTNPYENVPNSKYGIFAITSSEKVVGYDEKKTIDNEQLIFATRGVDLKDKYTSSYQIILPTYNERKTVKVAVNESGSSVTIENTVTNPFTYSVNGINHDIGVANADRSSFNVSAHVTLYSVDNGTFSGTPTICYYQMINSEKAINLRAIPVQMNVALPFANGALEYKLRSAIIQE